MEDIETNISRDLKLISSAITTIDQINISTEILKNVVRTNTAYSDTLSYHIDQATRSGSFLFKLTSDGYESLQSNGIKIIKNEQLKDGILSLFEVTYSDVLTSLQFVNSFYDYTWWKDYFYRTSENSLRTDEYTLIPYNPNQILQDKRFMTEILDISFLRNDFQGALKRSLIKSQKVLQMINKELRSDK